MALAVGNRVALKIDQAETSPEERSGIVNFGVVDDDGPPIAVQWENGAYSELADGTTLDKITPITSSTLAGKVCVMENYTSPEYRVVVLAVYNRQNNGAGDVQACALVKSISTGALFEALVSDLSPTNG